MDRRLFITSGLTGMSLGAALPLMAGAAADPKSPKPRNRDDATKIIAEARRIVTPDGVERLETVKIGGIDRWVSVRGKDRRNPVLLHIHGGPGYISIPMSWWFSRDWEEYFTVVQWDQRAAGKTHLLADPATIASTLTPERMIADAEEMAVWSPESGRRPTCRRASAAVGPSRWTPRRPRETPKPSAPWNPSPPIRRPVK